MDQVHGPLVHVLFLPLNDWLTNRESERLVHEETMSQWGCETKKIWNQAGNKLERVKFPLRTDNKADVSSSSPSSVGC